MKKISQRLQKRNKDMDFNRLYSLDEALDLLKDRVSAKFDETIDFVFASGVDPKKSDQNIRGMVSLPSGTGKSVRVAVFAEGDKASEARDAGADIIGGVDLVEQVASGQMDFDLCIATPSMMAHLSKLGRVLGPKGLMPNPKLGTVTMDVKGAVDQSKKGQVSVRTDKQGLIHGLLGKASFSKENLKKNFKAVYGGVEDLRPESLKGDMIKKVFLSSTMGFGLRVDVSKGLS
jgi:large subunit ribosomal protein L1